MHTYLLTYCTYLQYSCCWGLRVEIIVVVGILLKPNLDPATLLEKKKKRKKKKKKESLSVACMYKKSHDQNRSFLTGTRMGMDLVCLGGPCAPAEPGARLLC